MVAVVVGAGLSAGSGNSAVQSTCQYGACVSGTQLPWWALGVIVVVVLVALAAALLLMRRRRPPATGIRAAGPPAGPTTGAMRGPSAPPPSAAPAYLETPEDVGAGLPHVPPTPPTGATTAVAAGAAAGAATGVGAAAGEAEEPDIDSLMAELDKISGEILKRPKNAPEPKNPPDE